MRFSVTHTTSTVSMPESSNRLSSVRGVGALQLCAMAMVVVVVALGVPQAQAQQIDFSLTVGEGIQAEVLQVLDFNKFNGDAPLVNRESYTVPLTSAMSEVLGIVRITAAEEFEIEIDIDFDGSVLRPPSDRVDQAQVLPVVYTWGYSNRGSIDAATAINHIQPVPVGFAEARFPVLRSTTTHPGLPPAPVHGGLGVERTRSGVTTTYQRPVADVYLFIAGIVTVPNVPSGTYSGNVQISISYAGVLP